MPDKKYYSKQVTLRFLKAMDAITGNRESGKITAQAFGNSVGMSSSNINRLRSPETENTITVESLARLCENYKISPAWLITGEGKMLSKEKDNLEKRLGKIEKQLDDLRSLSKK
ncbi:MAG: hypothetical protein ABI237_05880 [Ginsengibacter sp.]